MTGDIEGILELGGAAAVEIAASALVERGEKVGTCPNCGSSLIGPYCAVCGQERDTHRRSVFGLLHDFFVDIANFDSRLLRTARALLFRPGELPRAFREGRTRAYVPALRLYLFVSLIFFLVLSFYGIAILQLQVVATPLKVIRDAKGNTFFANPGYDPKAEDAKYVPKLIPISKEKANQPGGPYNYSTDTYFFAPIGSHHSNLSPAAFARLKKASVEMDIDDEQKAAQTPANRAKTKKVRNWLETRVYGGIQRLAADPAALNGPLTTWIPRVLFLLLPLYAILLAMFYWRQRKKYYFVDHLIFSLTVHTFTFVALLAAVGLAQFLPGGLVAWSILAVISLYLFLSLKSFYEQGWFWTSVKFVFISGIYTLFFLLPALAGVLALSFLDT